MEQLVFNALFLVMHFRKYVVGLTLTFLHSGVQQGLALSQVEVQWETDCFTFFGVGFC